MMKRPSWSRQGNLTSILVVALSMVFVIGCSQSAPTPTPTQAPKKEIEDSGIIKKIWE
ncbi:MAG: hypothetical protein HYY30_06380 [Chloroflexi bacterium]|nr:hypothetical protein [Chloroflexota bacterium]